MFTISVRTVYYRPFLISRDSTTMLSQNVLFSAAM